MRRVQDNSKMRLVFCFVILAFIGLLQKCTFAIDVNISADVLDISTPPPLFRQTTNFDGVEDRLTIVNPIKPLINKSLDDFSSRSELDFEGKNTGHAISLPTKENGINQPNLPIDKDILPSVYSEKQVSINISELTTANTTKHHIRNDTKRNEVAKANSTASGLLITLNKISSETPDLGHAVWMNSEINNSHYNAASSIMTVSTSYIQNVTVSPMPYHGYRSITHKMDIGDFPPVMEDCKLYGTCTFVSALPFNLKFCNCDDMCSAYNDCCWDASVKSATSNKLADHRFECVIHKPEQDYGIFIVRTCPAQYLNVTVTERCHNENISSTGPWVISDDIVYQNKYCAKCHNKTDYEMFSVKFLNVVNVSVSDPSLLLEELLTKTNNGSLTPYKEMVPPYGASLRYCILTEPPDAGYEDLCKLFPNAPVIVDINDIYWKIKKNAYCLYFHMACYGAIVKDIEKIPGFFFPMTVVFSFSHAKDRCKHEDEVCIDKSLISNHDFDVTITYTSPITLSRKSEIYLAVVFFLSLPSEITVDDIYIISDPKEPGYYREMRFEAKLLNTYHVSDLFKTKEAFMNAKWQIRFLSTNGDTLEIDMARNTSLLQNGITNTRVNTLFIESRLTEYGITVSLNDMSYKHKTCGDYVVYCTLDGPDIESGFVIKEITCIDNKMTSDNNVQKILMYIGMATSVFALGVSLVVIRLSSMHNTMPWSNIQKEAIILILLHVLFAVRVFAFDSYVLCYTIAVSIHYLWLAFSTFKTITALHFYQSLRVILATNYNAKILGSNRKVTIISLFFPLLVIGPAIVADIFDIPEISINYGKQKCFPSAYPASIIFVMVPVGLSILLDTICLSPEAFNKASFKARRLGNIALFQNKTVLGLINFMSGLFLLVFIVKQSNESPITEFIYFVIGSFQGLLFTTAILFNARMRQVLFRLKV